jgi:hypothetical protein
MVAHSLWLLIIDDSSFSYNQIIPQESWLGGHLSSRNMISMYCIELVELIEMPMG